MSNVLGLGSASLRIVYKICHYVSINEEYFPWEEMASISVWECNTCSCGISCCKVGYISVGRMLTINQ